MITDTKPKNSPKWWCPAPIRRQAAEVYSNLKKNNLWKRILKCDIATSTLVAVALIPGARNRIGTAAYLGAVATVFCHPGRRFGQMAEGVVLFLFGSATGVGWGILALYLSSLCVKEDPSAAFAIRGIFCAAICMVHGYVRSKYPRLFLFVLIMAFVEIVISVSSVRKVSAVSATQLLYPIWVGVGILLVVNLCIFPEFSSSYLGEVTIETLNDISKALDDAGEYFVAKQERATNGTLNPQPDSEKVPVGLDHESSDLRRRESAIRRDRSPSFKRMVSAATKSEAEKTANENAQIKEKPIPTIKQVTSVKEKIRKKLAICREAQRECNYELFIGVLPPYELKCISSRGMKRLVGSTIAVISACESKFALIGQEPDPNTTIPTEKEGVLASSGSSDDCDRLNLKAVKPKREIEFGDARLLRYLIAVTSTPYKDLAKAFDAAFKAIESSTAYVYGVKKLSSGEKPPKDLRSEELDAKVTAFQQALSKFDRDFETALKQATAIEEMQKKEPDIMPREEVFLISSFMMNARAVGSHIEDMLIHSRELVSNHNQRRGRRRLHFPRIKWSQWLSLRGGDEEAMPASGRKSNRRAQSKERKKAGPTDSNEDLLPSTDLEKHPRPPLKKTKTKPIMKDNEEDQKPQPKPDLTTRLRTTLANTLDAALDSDDLTYALKLTVAIFLLLWPGFVPRWNTWFSLNRGLWASLQLIFVLEVSIGTSVQQFLIRLIAVTLGCLWGWAAVEARGGNKIVCVAMIFVGQLPFIYVQLATQYQKGGAVGIVTMCVVSLASLLDAVPGTPTQNFLKRWIAFLIGGTTAVIVELVFLPTKARTRMIESIVSALREITEMEKCIAVHIDDGVKLTVVAEGRQKQFERAAAKANAALGAAETFLPFTTIEPRLKAPFAPHAKIYTELLLTLHQITDRMENLLNLRTRYGFGPLEEFNHILYPYRRNVAGAITLTLFAVRSALATKLPLPQFVPSARIAHLRMINKAREVVVVGCLHDEDIADLPTQAHEKAGTTEEGERSTTPPPHHLARSRATRRKYLAWNAASAAQAEIIEFLEELVELTKLLTGANEFRSGLFLRAVASGVAGANLEVGDVPLEPYPSLPGAGAGVVGIEERMKEENGEGERGNKVAGLLRRRRRRGESEGEGEGRGEEKGGEGGISASLIRIQSRKQEAGRRRAETMESARIKRERAGS